MRHTIILCTTLLLGLWLMPSQVTAQNYRTAVGARLSNGIGLSVAQQLSRRITIEGIVMENIMAQREWTALAKRHFGLGKSRFNLYLGAGLHGSLDGTGEGIRGYDAMAGAELTLLRFTVAADVKPMWDINNLAYQGLGGSVSLRFVLFRDRNRNRAGSRSRTHHHHHHHYYHHSFRI